MLVSPDDQVHPVWNISGVERLMDRCTRPKAFFIPILMKDKDVCVVLDITFWLLKGDLLLFKQFIENLVLNVAKTIESDLAGASFLGDDQRSYDYLVKVEMLAEVGHIVASLQQVTC